jgi:hypothetical protein
MQVDAGPYKYQQLQTFVSVVLGFVHVALLLCLLVFNLFFVVMPLPTVAGVAIGVLEMAIGQKLPASMAILKLWLFAIGAITALYSVGCLIYALAVLS